MSLPAEPRNGSQNCSCETSTSVYSWRNKKPTTVRILRESPCGGGGPALVRCGGNVYWWVD
jgi:hypothetical protein